MPIRSSRYSRILAAARRCMFIRMRTSISSFRKVRQASCATTRRSTLRAMRLSHFRRSRLPGCLVTFVGRRERLARVSIVLCEVPQSLKGISKLPIVCSKSSPLLPVGRRIAGSSLVRRLVLAKDDPATQRIGAWLSDIDDERLFCFDLTTEDVVALRGTTSLPAEATIVQGLDAPSEDRRA
jgi:hypothetical protein